MIAPAPSPDERLPWLQSPRPPAERGASRAARRARVPLLVLLGLFAAGAVAIMAFLAGRESAPRTSRGGAQTPAVIVPPQPRAPVATPPVAAPAPVFAPAPVLAPPPPVAEAPVLAAAPTSRVSRPPRASVHRRTAARRTAAHRIKRRPAPRVVVHRNAVPAHALPPAYAVPQRRTAWPARPFAGPRGRVIQLGAFVTMARADAAWWRLVGVYPYLGTLPRMVTWSGPTPGRPRTYQVRLAAGSRREARALCRNLHRIGRGCVVV